MKTPKRSKSSKVTVQWNRVRLLPKTVKGLSALIAALLVGAREALDDLASSNESHRKKLDLSEPFSQTHGTREPKAMRTGRNATIDATPRLVGYVRVSTEDQAENGVSLDAQKNRLRAYAEAHGCDLVAIEEDAGVSGKVAPAKRGGYQRAIDRVNGGTADGIVALKLDRLSRSTRDVLDLVEDARRDGWRLVSVSESLDTGTAAGRMVLTILAALAQMEREQIGERTTMGMAQVAREGRARSRKLPFGYRLENHPDEVLVTSGNRDRLIVHESEHAILDRMIELRLAGYGAMKIATTLKKEGVVNPRTKKDWNYGTVAGILRTAERRGEA